MVATVPTACGIETYEQFEKCERKTCVATVPTACGIETSFIKYFGRIDCVLQQYLPLAVLKLALF